MNAAISINYYIDHGAATVSGTRITVSELVALYKNGSTFEQILERYPINRAQLHLALSYYYDHKEEIDK